VHIGTQTQEMSACTGLPNSNAAAVVFIVAYRTSHKKSFAEESKIAGVGVQTIKKYYKKIRSSDNIAALFPADFEFARPAKELPNY
jgi:transcription initiation factor TFIIIB Brf1 subunit/transcription initiation factor TFIIB